MMKRIVIHILVVTIALVIDTHLVSASEPLLSNTNELSNDENQDGIAKEVPVDEDKKEVNETPANDDKEVNETPANDKKEVNETPANDDSSNENTDLMVAGLILLRPPRHPQGQGSKQGMEEGLNGEHPRDGIKDTPSLVPAFFVSDGNGGIQLVTGEPLPLGGNEPQRKSAGRQRMSRRGYRRRYYYPYGRRFYYPYGRRSSLYLGPRVYRMQPISLISGGISTILGGVQLNGYVNRPIRVFKK